MTLNSTKQWNFAELECSLLQAIGAKIDVKSAIDWIKKTDFPPSLGRFLDVRPPHSVLNLDCRQKVSNANESSRMISSWCQGPIQFKKFVKKRLFFWGLIVRQSPVLQVRCNVACKPRSCANCIALTSSRFQRQAWIYIPRCTIKSWGQVPGWIFISTNTHWGKTRLFINTPMYSGAKS